MSVTLHEGSLADSEACSQIIHEAQRLFCG